MDPFTLLVLANSAGAGLFLLRWLNENKWSYQYIRKSANVLKRLSPLYGVNQSLTRISTQLYTNGGSSLRDTINRIDAKTETIQSAVALLRVTVRYREIAYGLATFVTDGEGRCTWASPGYLNLCGLTLENVLGYGWLNAIHQDDRELVKEAWEYAVTHKTDYRVSHRYWRYTDKEAICVTVTAMPAIVNDKSVGWFGQVIRDDCKAMDA